MPKKSCCCVPAGTYIAIPCRYYSGRKFTGGDARWAHYEQGGPDPIGGFGGGQSGLLGPFRVVNGQVVFDETRKIIYMLRGAGGGASKGITNGDVYSYGLGGNGAYTEYKKNASINDVVRPGAGGLGGEIVRYTSYIPPSTKYKGGKTLSVDGDGGDAAVLGNGTDWANNAVAVAGAGGGGAYFYRWTYEENIPYIGPRDGGHAGITQGKKGEDGFAVFPPIGVCGGGSGATETVGGAAGYNQGLPNYRALDGTNQGGGRAQYTNPAHLTPYGMGGGGGAGKYGGGGGAFDGGGGGGSSTKNTEYYFNPSDEYSANYCNPYMDNDAGMGGRRLPSNTSTSGSDGQIVQYYIKGFCDCDPTKNEIPDLMFICLNSNQYANIIKQLGPVPDPPSYSGNYERLFTYDGEEYILLGPCDQQCEEIYRVPVETEFTNVRWSWRENNEGEGIAGTPPCCSQIVCRPVCPVEGANCAQCGCSEYNDVLVCCDTKNKPDTYTSVYNGWIYSCVKSNQNWIIPGTTQNVVNLCLDPQDAECSDNPKNCEYTIPDNPWTKCPWNYPDPNICNLSITATASVSVGFPNTCSGGYPPYCIVVPVNVNTTIQLNTSTQYCSLYGTALGPSKATVSECIVIPNDPYDYLYQSSCCLNFAQSRVIEEDMLEIQFDCIPPQSEFGLYPVSIPLGNGAGEWIICGAKVNVTSCTIDELVEALNLRLSPRVIVTSKTSAYRHIGGSFPDLITNIIATIDQGKLKITVKTGHTFVRACGTLQLFFNTMDEGRCVDFTFPPYFGGGVGAIQSGFIGREIDSWNITQDNLGLGTICPCINNGLTNETKCEPDICGVVYCTNPGFSTISG